MARTRASRLIRTSCCPHSSFEPAPAGGMSRRDFLQRVSGATVIGATLTKWNWSELPPVDLDEGTLLVRRPLKVMPILVYGIPKRQPQTSWRSWGGIQTRMDAEQEMIRIQNELNQLRAAADFPLEFWPVAGVQKTGDLPVGNDLAAADVILVYAAGGWMDVFNELPKFGKEIIFFCRHKSGPVYLWYEIISPRYLRQHTDQLAVTGVDDGDVVVDSRAEILWRLRSLAGLRNTVGTRILAVGGPSAWAQPEGVVPKLVEDKFKFDIRTISYDDLGRLIRQARADQTVAEAARHRAAAYLSSTGCTLETARPFVDNAFLLEQVFCRLMKEAECRAITINGCMGTIMPLAETSACLTLSLLNDAGYLAFCESDFVVIPSGVLLANISGRPVFLNDPTYPHDGLITLAHCTAPRKMDGKKLEPARILTHFESDYGAAPKVEMSRGQTVTNIAPDFAFQRWVGLLGTIEDVPFLDICRSQIDVRYTCGDRILAETMPGFHWMTGYGDYSREVGYALKRVGIRWQYLA